MKNKNELHSNISFSSVSAPPAATQAASSPESPSG